MYTDTDIYYDEERILQAKDLISEWENVKAKRVLEEILQDDPLCETAHYLLGWIYDHRFILFSFFIRISWKCCLVAPNHYIMVCPVFFIFFKISAEIC